MRDLTIDEARNLLLESGFQESPNPCSDGLYFYIPGARRNEEVPSCLQNERPPGVSVVLHNIRHPSIDKWFRSVSFELTGQTPTGWVQFKSYGHDLNEGVLDLYEIASEQLYRAWSNAFGDTT